jgi:hypothetical protein
VGLHPSATGRPCERRRPSRPDGTFRRPARAGTDLVLQVSLGRNADNGPSTTGGTVGCVVEA